MSDSNKSAETTLKDLHYRHGGHIVPLGSWCEQRVVYGVPMGQLLPRNDGAFGAKVCVKGPNVTLAPPW